MLQNLGVVDDLLAEAEDSPNPERAAAATALLHKIVAAGGNRVAEAMSEASGSVVEETLVADTAAADAAVGKVRAA